MMCKLIGESKEWGRCDVVVVDDNNDNEEAWIRGVSIDDEKCMYKSKIGSGSVGQWCGIYQRQL